MGAHSEHCTGIQTIDLKALAKKKAEEKKAAKKAAKEAAKKK